MLLELYSDGSAEERVGRPGGWAFIIVRCGEVVTTGQGMAPKTTSLVMELEGALAALTEVLARGWHTTHPVVLVSDSSIALEVAAGRFVPRPERYATLCQALRMAALEARAATRWVRAHAGEHWNEQVDALAHQARSAALEARRARPHSGGKARIR